MNELRKMKIAYDFEHTLACYIYPPGKARQHHREIFLNLMKWLRENQKNREGREAYNRWIALANELGWSPRHESAFLKMLNSSREAAHQELVDSELLIPSEFDDGERSLVEMIHKMVIKLNDLLKNC